MGMSVNRPRAGGRKHRPLGEINVTPLVVSLKADGSLFLQETAVEGENLVPRLKAISDANPQVRIFVRGDEAVAYGKVLGVMGRIQAAGFERVALVAQLPDLQ